MDNNHHNCSSNIQQACTVRSVDEKLGKKILTLEPIKQKCSSCDGKCEKMIKPSNLIGYQTDKDDIKAGDTVYLSIKPKDLSKIVILTLGAPLMALIISLVICFTIDLPDSLSAAISFGMLAITFIIATKKTNLSTSTIDITKK